MSHYERQRHHASRVEMEKAPLGLGEHFTENHLERVHQTSGLNKPLVPLWQRGESVTMKKGLGGVVVEEKKRGPQ